MSKKKIYIILGIMFSIFIVAMIIAFNYRINANKLDSSETDLKAENWAVNDVKDRNSSSETEINSQVINNILYENFNNLTYEQQADKDSLFKLAINCMVEEKARHGEPKQIEILDTSNDYFAYLLVTFEDDSTQEYISVYDETNTHSFLNCQTIEQWEYYHSDANKG